MENQTSRNRIAAEHTAYMDPLPAARPVFLTILCVLSFIGFAFSIFWNVIGYIGMSVGNAVLKETHVLEDIEEAAGKIQSTEYGIRQIFGFIEQIPSLALINILSSFIILGGVVLMWNLRKSGYFIYVAGKLLPLIALLALGGSVGTLFAVSTSVFTVLFIILYGMNLKYMS